MRLSKRIQGIALAAGLLVAGGASAAAAGEGDESGGVNLQCLVKKNGCESSAVYHRSSGGSGSGGSNGQAPETGGSSASEGSGAVPSTGGGEETTNPWENQEPFDTALAGVCYNEDGSIEGGVAPAPGNGVGILPCANNAAEGDTADAADAGDGPTLESVVIRAFDQLNYSQPDAQVSACQNAIGCRGTVGVPVWLWTGDGGSSLPSDWSSVSAGPYSVSASAEVTKVTWDLGDGQTVTCDDAGTVYDKTTHGWSSSPDCGFEAGWKKPGTYTVTATYHWEIDFSGNISGSLTDTVSATEEVTVGEYQALVGDAGRS